MSYYLIYKIIQFPESGIWKCICLTSSIKSEKKYIYNDTEEQKVANSHILEAAIYKNFFGIFAVTMTEVVYSLSK